VLAMLLLAAFVHHALGVEGARPWLARSVAAVLVLAALAVAWSAARDTAERPWDKAVDEAVDAAEVALAASEAERATVALREATAALPASAPGAALLHGLPAIAASAAAADASPSGDGPPQARTEAELRRLVERLEQLQREHRPPTLAERLDAMVAELGLGFGWGIVYFSLLPALWPGRTVGKAALKLRIAELSGRPLTPLRGLKRYGGYAAGIATGGLGFAQALWDPNRQCLHDKAAHTVVLDERHAAPGPAV
jgi:RDD family